MDLKQYCLDAIERVMLIIAKKWDTMVSNMSIQYRYVYTMGMGNNNNYCLQHFYKVEIVCTQSLFKKLVSIGYM